MDLHDDSGKIANLEVFVWHSYFLCFFLHFWKIGSTESNDEGVCFSICFAGIASSSV